jgi:acid phosphatase (class A)
MQSGWKQVALALATGTTLMLASACAGTSPRDAERPYALPASLDVTRLLSPPPAGEEARARDLAAVRAAQAARSAAQEQHAETSSNVDVFLFAQVLGESFTRERLPLTADFYQRVYRSALPYLQLTKDCWGRARPFVVDPTLAPLGRALESTRLRSAPAPAAAGSQPPADSPCTAPVAAPQFSPSYPSGHATVGVMMAILLAQMVPERRADLFAYGWDYGEARIVSGVHFPSDVEAGRILGTMLVGVMQQDARFRRDFGAARRELRAALGLD